MCDASPGGDEETPPSDLQSNGGPASDASGASPEPRSDGARESATDSRSRPERQDGSGDGPDAESESDARGEAKRPDGGEQLQAHTVRLELVDEPGELLRTLRPIAENGGNLLSIFHERGSLTPRGHIPVEIDLECTPGRFEDIVDALRDAGVNVIQTDAERYGERVAVVVYGHLIETDLSDTLSRVEDCGEVSVVDISLSAPDGTAEMSSARLRLAAAEGSVETALEAVRSIAEEKGLRVVEPLVGGRR